MTVAQALGNNYFLVTIDGEEYKIAPADVGCFSAVENHLNEKMVKYRQSMIKEYNTYGLSKELLSDLIKQLMIDTKVTNEAVNDCVNSVEGMTIVLNRCFKKYQPDLPKDFVENLSFEQIAEFYKVIVPEDETNGGVTTGEVVKKN